MDDPALIIRDVRFPEDSETLRNLIHEYVDWLAIDLSYQNYEEEMKSLESLFSLPNGQYTFAVKDSEIAGGVGFKAIDRTTVEVKRLYVRTQYQGLGIGFALMRNLLNKVEALGYKRVVLDAVPPTIHAQYLYEAMGFREIPPYFNNPTPGTKFFEYQFDNSVR